MSTKYGAGIGFGERSPRVISLREIKPTGSLGEASPGSARFNAWRGGLGFNVAKPLPAPLGGFSGGPKPCLRLRRDAMALFADSRVGSTMAKQ